MSRGGAPARTEVPADVRPHLNEPSREPPRAGKAGGSAESLAGGAGKERSPGGRARALRRQRRLGGDAESRKASAPERDAGAKEAEQRGGAGRRLVSPDSRGTPLPSATQDAGPNSRLEAGEESVGRVDPAERGKEEHDERERRGGGTDKQGNGETHQ